MIHESTVTDNPKSIQRLARSKEPKARGVDTAAAARRCEMDQMMGKRTAQQHAMSTMCSMSRQVNQERLAGVFSSCAHSAHTLTVYCSQQISSMLQSWSKCMAERTKMMIATSAHTCVLATRTRQFSANSLCFRLTHQRKHSLAPQCCMLPLSCTGALLIYSTALTLCSSATHEAVCGPPGAG